MDESKPLGIEAIDPEEVWSGKKLTKAEKQRKILKRFEEYVTALKDRLENDERYRGIFK